MGPDRTVKPGERRCEGRGWAGAAVQVLAAQLRGGTRKWYHDGGRRGQFRKETSRLLIVVSASLRARHFVTELGTPKPAVFALDAATSVRTAFASTSTRWAPPIHEQRGTPAVLCAFRDNASRRGVSAG